MAWTNLFKIGNTDLTKWEDTSKHSVNRIVESEEWQDGNWAIHRVSRTRVNGSVVLNFARASDYAAFIALLQSAKTADGNYPISVWCSNSNTVEALNAFLDVVGSTAIDVTAPIKHNTVTIEITGVEVS